MSRILDFLPHDISKANFDTGGHFVSESVNKVSVWLPDVFVCKHENILSASSSSKLVEHKAVFR